MIRVLDVIFSIFGLVFLSPLLLIVVAVLWLDNRSPLFLQERVGRSKQPFILVKFRTMRMNSPFKATHLVDSSLITPIGSFLRKSKIDELPQLWNVIKGDMSLIGPRPCLFTQRDLIIERDKRGVYSVRPGITGLAQIRGIDMSDHKFLAKIDAEMLSDLSILKYFRYIFLTIVGFGFGDNVRKK